ncbi:unnamed protein product [Cyprideis torosa]|uniref:Uncharacterized protein n=1 Tax=Cyprideis torosa TaxID=163714 RepID=A0A7R8WBE6_9CRUS|nr:unnamed protein product [Cyprideis torosa]CAG0889520.1 unnamed protein product [Cyprideis torosa]
MIYASTKATLKQLFGASDVKKEYNVTAKEEVSLHHFLEHERITSAPGPLTAAEEELQDLKKMTISATEISTDSRQASVSGLQFPFMENLTKKLNEFRKRKVSYVQMKLDLAKETVDVVSVRDETPSINELPSLIPSDSARYHLFRFKYVFEGMHAESVIFIYSMPGYDCPIKERMLYSSCKNPTTH